MELKEAYVICDAQENEIGVQLALNLELETPEIML